MRVDQLCATTRGGAGGAALDLHRALRGHGVDSRLWSADSPAGGETTSAAGAATLPPFPATSWRDRARRRLAKLRQSWQRPCELFSPSARLGATPFPAATLDGELLHLHWVSRLIDHSTFFATLPANRPIVWTLHDVNPVTGGCHYPGGCRAFESSCGHCLLLRRGGPGDVSARSFAEKRLALAGVLDRLHVVAPSRWMAQLVGRSALLGRTASIQRIGYAVDTEVFSPSCRLAARRALGLPDGQVVLAFGADTFDSRNRRKGLAELVESVRRLRTRTPVAALLFGEGAIPRELSDRLPVRALGFVAERSRLAAAYAAADLFVLPSLEDNLPLTGLEALACGTPVAAFAAGGIPDYVRHDTTGLLAPVGDCAALAAALDKLIDRPEVRRELGAAGRRLVLDEYSPARVAAEHQELYLTALDRCRRRAPRDIATRGEPRSHAA